MNKNEKYIKLAISIVLDLIGNISYIIPGFGESIDIFWAPMSAFLMTKLYKGNAGKLGAILAFIEEAFIFTDIVPSFTLMWLYTYVIKKHEEDNTEINEIGKNG